MARKYSELRARMPRRSRERAAKRTQGMLREMPLNELRRAREMTQESLAETLGGKQSGVSKLERRTDMYVSTLRRYVEAMGGELEIVARFPEGDVRISQFEGLAAPE